MDQKKCCRCGIEYPATAEFFSRQTRRGKQGLTSQCKTCRSKMWNEQYEKNRDYLIKKASESTKKRRECAEIREKERISSREAKRRKLSDPIERERHRMRTNEWFKNNKDRVNQLPSRNKSVRAYYTSMYSAAELRAMPKWANKNKIAELYVEAKRMTDITGIPHEVDHIIPLRHRLASGLHTESNLRVITRTENRSRSNRFME